MHACMYNTYFNVVLYFALTFHHGLLHEMIDANMLLGRNEEEWLAGMETCPLHITPFGLIERLL